MEVSSKKAEAEHQANKGDNKNLDLQEILTVYMSIQLDIKECIEKMERIEEKVSKPWWKKIFG